MSGTTSATQDRVPLTQRPLVRKLFKYCVASLSGTIVGVGSFTVFLEAFEWSAVPANIVAVTLGTIPNYLVNRYWTWERAGRDRMTTEVTVFWLIALLGLAISTGCVSYAENRWDSTLPVVIAQVAGFGVLWVGRFLFLDRVLYRVAEATTT